MTAPVDLLAKIRTFPDFPVKGILFRDIATLIRDPKAFRHTIKGMVARYGDKRIEAVAGVESRGFIFGAALAYELGVPFIPIRKQGKLPGKVETAEYLLEYSVGSLQIQSDAVGKGQRVLVVDDLLATGGTARASIELVERLGAKVVGVCFLVELVELKGRDKLQGYDVFSLVRDARK